MASPAFIAAGAELEVNSGSGAYTGNVAVPAGVADGDFLLLVVRNTRADATIATPSGWTSITAHEKTSISHSDLRLFRRDAASEPSTYTISNDGAGNGVNAFSAQILAWGPATLETSATWESTSTNTTVACPAVTSGGADRTLVCVYGQYGNVQGSISYTPPSGMTERTDQNFVDSVGNNTSFSVADLAISASGSTGTKNATASDGSPWHLAVSLLLQGTAGGGGSSTGAPTHRALLGMF